MVANDFSDRLDCYIANYTVSGICLVEITVFTSLLVRLCPPQRCTE